MELPNDIAERLERRWLARHKQELQIRHRPRILNEAEVTDQKVVPGSQAALRQAACRSGPEGEHYE